jgi:tetratricopeptide (TPR) repeat protein
MWILLNWLMELLTSGAVVILALYLAGPFLHLLQSWRLRQRLHRRMLAGKLNPSGFEARMALGEIYVSSRRWTKAIGELEAASEIDDRHAYCQSLLGKALFHAGQFEKAASHLEAALAIRADEGYGWTHLLVGRCYDALGNREKAAEWYRAAARRNSSLAEPLYRLALTLRVAGDQAGYSNELRNAIRTFSRYDRRNYWRNLKWSGLARARLLLGL